MSATNRETERHGEDFYRTPEWCTLAILPHVAQPNVLLDPSAGDGAILDAARKYYKSTTHVHVALVGMELVQRRADALRDKGFDDVHHVDSLKQKWPTCQLVVANPPYKLAEKFVAKSLHELPNATHAYLLGLNFATSVSRAEFHVQHPSDIYIFSKRPSFSNRSKCSLKKDGCGAVMNYRTKRCPKCGRCSSVVHVQSDMSDYAWFVWGPTHGGRWYLL